MMLRVFLATNCSDCMFVYSISILKEQSTLDNNYRFSLRLSRSMCHLQLTRLHCLDLQCNL